MLGALCGHIIGSIYEHENLKSKDFPLFQRDGHFMDDTVLTCAVAEIILEPIVRSSMPICGDMIK